MNLTTTRPQDGCSASSLGSSMRRRGGRMSCTGVLAARVHLELSLMRSSLIQGTFSELGRLGQLFEANRCRMEA